MPFLKLDKKAKKDIWPYITQSLLAFISMGIILFFLNVLTHAAIVAALGSSVFIVFVMPHSYTAQPQRLIGGHTVGVISGTICAFLVTPFLGHILLSQSFAIVLSASLAVALSIFLMCLTDTEHAPAAGTALGLTVHSWSFKAVLFILTSAIILSIVRKLLGNKLKDL